MSGLNGPQQNHLLITLRHLDGLLRDCVRKLASGGPTSPFAEYIADATPVQAKVIADSVAHLCEVMARVLPGFGIRLPAPRISALGAARTALLYAEIALEELNPQGMRAYGEMSEETAHEITGVVAELKGAVRRMAGYLAPGTGGDLTSRLDRLAGPAEADLLRRLAGVVTALGLVELRPSLGLLVDRLASPSFEIAVFGRVSSGKSSLLNRLLRRNLLPVGVTPVTAVPVCVGYGAEPAAHISFADREPTTVPLAGLAEFATEERNPGNVRHVAKIEVALPEARLSGGATLVDTPGLGSLATAGAAETLAYLPRCDLGVLLIDSASAITPEDLAVIDALHASGAGVTVLLSKADLLSSADRERLATYTREKIRAWCGIEVAVHPVSVAGSDGALADAWFECEILPLVQRQRELALASLRRKAELLRQTVVQRLEDRLAIGRPGAEPPSKEPPTVLTETLRRAAVLAEDAPRRAADLLAEAGPAVGGLLRQAAAELAAHWPERRFDPAAAREILSVTVESWTVELAGRLVGLLSQTREKLGRALAAASGTGSERGESEALPRPAGMPAFDAATVVVPVVLRRPALAPLGRWYLGSWATARLEEQLAERLAAALGVYRKLLGSWARVYLAKLGGELDARAETLRAAWTGVAGSETEGAEVIREALCTLGADPGQPAGSPAEAV